MNIEEIRNYCLSKKGVEESFPFDENVLTFKLMGKIFALCPINSSPLSINLKCDPERAVLLREEYEEITPGYHMNKKHWNTLVPEGLPGDLVKELIDHSYTLIFCKLTKAQKEEFNRHA